MTVDDTRDHSDFWPCKANGHNQLGVSPRVNNCGQPEQCTQRGCVTMLVKSFNSHAIDAHLHLNLTVQEH